MGRTPLNEMISEHQSRDLEPSEEEHAQLRFLWERRDACGTKMNFPLLSGGAGLLLSDPEGLWLSEMGTPPVPTPGGSDLCPRGSSFVWEQTNPPWAQSGDFELYPSICTWICLFFCHFICRQRVLHSKPQLPALCDVMELTPSYIHEKQPQLDFFFLLLCFLLLMTKCG